MHPIFKMKGRVDEPQEHGALSDDTSYPNQLDAIKHTPQMRVSYTECNAGVIAQQLRWTFTMNPTGPRSHDGFIGLREEGTRNGQ